MGCGRIARSHIAALDAHGDDAELVAVCDPINDRMESLPWSACAKLSSACLRFSSLDRLIDAHTSGDVPLDVMILATPSGLHARQIVRCAEAGVDVVTEKPMATRWRDALGAVRACDEANTRLFVVKQNRFNATIQLLQRAIRDGRFGRIFMVTINVFWQRPQEYYDAERWRGTWELDGGALMNQASHYIDLLDYLIGPVERVHAMTATLARSIQVEDTGVLAVRWRSGALGSVNVTMLTYPKNLEGSITVIGERGTVRLGGVAVNEIQLWNFADSRDYDATIHDASYGTTSVYGFGHPAYYRNVIDTIRGRATALTDGREGLRSLEVLIAAYLSARDGRAVALPLEY